jgi:hypothetical protein
VRVQTDRLRSITAYFALRQHGTFLSFSQKFGSQSQIFVKKNVPFRPAGGESGRLSRQMPDLKLTA